MYEVLNGLDVNGYIVIGEEERSGVQMRLAGGQHVGTGQGPEVDVVVDSIEGRRLLAQGLPDAIAVAGAAPRGSMWATAPAIYMEKIVVDREVASALVPDCMDAPAGWTLALVARVKQKEIRDLVVFVLDRPRHRDLIEEIRGAGARVLLRPEGDVAGALMAASPHVQVDVLIGVGGVAEGVIAACAVKAIRGGMLGRLAPQSEEERVAVEAAGLDTRRILTCDELVSSDEVFFSATGITDGVLLAGVRYRGSQAKTESLVLRCETGTRRIIHTEHLLK